MNNLYESASAEMLAEIVREAESLLDNQLTAAIAADQRALTFAGLLVAAIGAMLGAVASLGGKVSLSIVAVASILSMAAALALWSARPTAWKFRGNAPSQWERDVIGQLKLHVSMAEMAANYEVACVQNERAIDRAARAMRGSLILTAMALIASLAWSWAFVLHPAAPSTAKRPAAVPAMTHEAGRGGSMEHRSAVQP